jgi:hypothetical protein
MCNDAEKMFGESIPYFTCSSYHSGSYLLSGILAVMSAIVFGHVARGI